MKNYVLPMRALSMILVFFVLSAFFAPAFAQTTSDDQEKVRNQIERAKIYRDVYPLISDTDLYCSIFAYDTQLPDLRVTDAERGAEKILQSDGDLIFINKGKADGLEIGQVFLVIEVGDKIGSFGYLAQKRGRAHVTFLEERRAVARVEKSCGRVMVGNYLVPFEEKEGLLGKDMGFEAFSEGGSGPIGNIIYLERDYNQIGSGGYAIIDLGEDNGIQIGQQLTIYRTIRKDLPREGIGNLVVIETRAKTATIKVLSCSDAIRKGMQVQAALLSSGAKSKEVAPPPAEEQPKQAEETKPAQLSEEELFKSKSLDQLNQEQPLKMIHFDYDKYFIRDDAKPILEANAAWLNKFKTTRIRIEGHADERGTEKYNMVLGQKRAKSTLDYLVSLGIPQERMEIISYGKTRPLDTGKNEAAWTLNRRAQFLIIAK
jgi:peptidoglycan-associated lipoprotein